MSWLASWNMPSLPERSSHLAIIPAFPGVSSILSVSIGSPRACTRYSRLSLSLGQKTRMCRTVSLPWPQSHHGLTKPGTLRLKRKSRSPILPVLAWTRIELSALWSPLWSLRTCLSGGFFFVAGARDVWFCRSVWLCCHLWSQSLSSALLADSPASHTSSYLLRSGTSGPVGLRRRVGLIRIHLAAMSHLAWISDAMRCCWSLSSDAATLLFSHTSRGDT